MALIMGGKMNKTKPQDEYPHHAPEGLRVDLMVAARVHDYIEKIRKRDRVWISIFAVIALLMLIQYVVLIRYGFCCMK